MRRVRRTSVLVDYSYLNDAVAKGEGVKNIIDVCLGRTLIFSFESSGHPVIVLLTPCVLITFELIVFVRFHPLRNPAHMSREIKQFTWTVLKVYAYQSYKEIFHLP